MYLYGDLLGHMYLNISVHVGVSMVAWHSDPVASHRSANAVVVSASPTTCG